MSDPVTNAEVEDVLSSIRRLVSEDKRPLQTQKKTPPNDRLVLTPALRVAEHAEDDDDATDHAVAEAMQDVDISDADADADENMAEGDTFDDPAHDYADDPYNFEDDADLDGDGDEVLDLSGLEIATRPGTDGDMSLKHALSDEMEFDAEDADADDGEDVTAEDETDMHGGAADDVMSDARVPDAVSGDDTAIKDGSPRTAATLSAKIEALENAIGKISDEWEPDEPGADDYSGTEAPAMVWEDDVDQDALDMRLDEIDAEDGDNALEADDADDQQGARSEPASGPQPAEFTAETDTGTADDADSFAYAADDQLIDEEALRDLVSDIVRAELQGALGERITRNVRKLVRREIHRALTAQELE